LSLFYPGLFMIRKLIDHLTSLSKRRTASAWLAFVSFIEAIIFPIPPDVMLLPLCLVNRERALYFAFLTTIFSVFGGIFGYLIGQYFFEDISALLLLMGVSVDVSLVQPYFDSYGVLVILLASLTPIPYKIFTVTAGFLGFPLLTFVVSSAIGRGIRFFLEAIIVILFYRLSPKEILKYVNTITLILAILLFLYYFL